MQALCRYLVSDLNIYIFTKGESVTVKLMTVETDTILKLQYIDIHLETCCHYLINVVFHVGNNISNILTTSCINFAREIPPAYKYTIKSLNITAAV